MALGTVDEGTQSATGDHTLEATAVAGTYVGMWNLDDMVDGDVIECRITTKVLDADTEGIIYSGFYQHGQGSNYIVASPPVVSMHDLTMSVHEIGANTVSVSWSLIRIAEYA